MMITCAYYYEKLTVGNSGFLMKTVIFVKKIFSEV